MSSHASKGLGSDGAVPDGFSIDRAQPKYRQLTNRNGILEYTIEEGEITVDWIEGKNAALMIQQVLDHEGGKVRRISGYLTDKLGDSSNEVLQRFGQMLARRLTGRWTATIKRIAGRRYFILTR